MLGRGAGRRTLLWAALLLAPGLLHTSAEAYPRPGTLERVSVGVNGAQASFAQPVIGKCLLVRTVDPCTTAISAAGRYVAFSSPADNLVANDKNHAPDVFVRDQQTGRTELVSVSVLGGSATIVPDPAGSGGSFQPDVSADGRFVAFASNALDLVLGKKTRNFDVFVRDRSTGTTARVSIAANGPEALGDSTAPVISADGRYIAYESDAPNLVAGDTNVAVDVFEYDRQTKQTVRLSVSSQGVQGDGGSQAASISADGHDVAFTSNAGNLVAAADQDPGTLPDPLGLFHHTAVYLRDVRTHKTEAVSVHTGSRTPSEGSSGSNAISADGRYVAFYASDENYVPNDSAAAGSDRDSFVHDRKTGKTERISVTSSGSELNTGGVPGTYSEGLYPSISADGRFVTFYMETAPYPAASQASYVMLHDRFDGSTEVVSFHDNLLEATGCANDGQTATAGNPGMVMSSDARYVAFTSCDATLVKGDTNNQVDVFFRDRGSIFGVNALRNVGYVSAPAALPASARVVTRPALRDLFISIDVASMPSYPLASPSTIYGLDLTVRGVRYQVRAAKVGVRAEFGLFRLDPTLGWTEVSSLEGGYGTVSPGVTVNLPLRAVGATSGRDLNDVAAFVGLGSFATGPA